MNKTLFPDISVIVCAYNHEKWIERCIRSIINQVNIKKDKWELIIIDDNSNDSSKEILKQYKSIHNIHIVTNKRNLGLPKSLNIALKKAKGRYITRVDSDDYVARNYLHISSLYLDMNREYQAVASDYVLVNNNEQIIKKVNCFKKQIACGVMFRKECLFDIGLYNEKFKMREGHELRVRFEKKFKVGRLEFPFYKYRKHEFNRTNDKNKTDHYDNFLKNK
ncbi:glycosyltransferase family 2 protein [Candidatus Pelagibacter sp.]|uniref:glycosyltransferase family 2 protein n=1 Tax=Candidatus Pelagibacter sp. TaxID=2024849 RepID=UPI003F83510A